MDHASGEAPSDRQVTSGSLAASTAPPPSPAQSPPPDWPNVPFAVGCARCGHDLRGQSEPVCPACQLAFDWADAVPVERLICGKCGYHLFGLLEARCPECGTAFTWEEALDRYRRSRKPIFEYRWRRRPVRSFARTCWLAIRPWRLWRYLELHDPPRALAIGSTCVLALLVSAGLFLLFASLINAVETFVDYFRNPWTKNYIERHFTQAVMDILTAGFFGNEALAFLIGIVNWLGITFLAMLLYQPSLRRAAVRTGHVWRIAVYGCVLPIPALVLLFGVAHVTYTGLSSFLPRSLDWFLWRFMAVWALDTASWTLIALATVSISGAYRHYLRFRHAMGMAVGAQAIAILSAYAVGELLPVQNLLAGALVSLLDGVDDAILMFLHVLQYFRTGS